MSKRIKNERSSGNCCRRFFMKEVEDIKTLTFWRACFVEYLATLLLCFYHIAILLIMPGMESPSVLHVSIGHGLYVAAAVTALGATSGCHMNPAVTLAFFTLRHIGFIRTCLYIVSQCAGAITGVMLLREISHPNMTGQLGLISPGTDIQDKQVVCTEVIITAFLMLVVVATSDKTRDDIVYSVPLIVGLTICVNTILANKVSGSCMNPARALGPAVVIGDYKHLWMYVLGPFCGAQVGAHFYSLILAPTTSPWPVCKCCGQYKSSEEIDTRQERKSFFSELDTLPESSL